jgi:hypothetical protein
MRIFSSPSLTLVNNTPKTCVRQNFPSAPTAIDRVQFGQQSTATPDFNKLLTMFQALGDYPYRQAVVALYGTPEFVKDIQFLVEVPTEVAQNFKDLASATPPALLELLIRGEIAKGIAQFLNSPEGRKLSVEIDFIDDREDDYFFSYFTITLNDNTKLLIKFLGNPDVDPNLASDSLTREELYKNLARRMLEDPSRLKGISVTLYKYDDKNTQRVIGRYSTESQRAFTRGNKPDFN